MLKVAILDMYNGVTNQGMRCIKEILDWYKDELTYQVFDVRVKAEVPDTSFDIYISTGGPGHPIDDCDGVWDKKYYNLIDQLWAHNLQHRKHKKYVFFICHSFQMACHHFKVGKITSRKSMSFGTFPAHKTPDGAKDLVLKGLENTFYIADFRHYQVVEPNHKWMYQHGYKILVLEKERPHVDLERAVMGVRFSEEFVALQFHPEADGDGMLDWFLQEDKKEQVIKEHGEAKYRQMISDLADPNKIELTQHKVLPNFLEFAIKKLKAKRFTRYLTFFH